MSAFIRFRWLVGALAFVILGLSGCDRGELVASWSDGSTREGGARDQKGPPKKDRGLDQSRKDSKGLHADGAAADRSIKDAPTKDQAGSGPQVAILSPVHGATLSNPVLFKISATKVQQVQLVADKVSPLSAPWDPTQRDWLLYRFSGTGKARAIRLLGLVGGKEVASHDITITIKPDPCEDLFFVSKFNATNTDPTGTLDLVSIRETALSDIKAAVATLKACGATVTLGGMLSLLYFEGNLKAAFYNTKCAENSYHKMASGCDVYPQALYSYQLGIGTIHTSNFHPCKGGSYTQGMRQKLLAAIAASGFSTSAGLVTPQVISQVQSFCPGTSATVVDHYILGAHTPYGVPKNSSGNALDALATYPFFRSAVSVAMAFAEMAASCSTITDDRKAIAVYGGSSSFYKDYANQTKILAAYQSFAATNCP